MAETKAFISGFTYDIFISYAHADNVPLVGQEAGWVEQFQRELNILLSRRWRPGDIKIWWDNRRLDGSTVFDHSIEEGIRGSAIFLCLVSNGYMQSDYCRKEMELFYGKAQKEAAGIRVGDRSRILNVLLNNLPHEQWPTPLQGASGFPFHDANGNDPLDVCDMQCKNQMKKLRDALVGLITGFPRTELPATAGKNQMPGKEQEEKDVFTIFFGDVSDSLRTVRKRTITELEKAGYLCELPPPLEAGAGTQLVTEKIAKANLSVHLLDQFPGREVEGGEGIWYPQQQAEIGLSVSKAPLIWVPSDLAIEPIEEAGYKQFLQDLEGGKRTEKKYDYIRGLKGELPQQIADVAEKLKLQQKAPSTNGKLAVLLDVHVEDQKYAWELGTSLLEHRIQPILNPQEDNPRETSNLLGEKIGEANKLVFFYGKVDWMWVQRRVNAAMKLIINNDYAVDEFFVFLVPPHKNPADIAFEHRFLKVNVINNSDAAQLDKNTLQQFLNTLKAVA